MACPSGDESVQWNLVIPESDENPEAGGLERRATCAIDAIGGDAEHGWTLSLVCDEVDGAVAQPYVLTIEMVESPLATLDMALPVDVHYVRWWAFEVGSGARFSVTQGGSPRFVAIAESTNGGLGQCAQPDAGLRAAANEWLAIIDARVEPAGCDPEHVFRVARTIDGTVVYAYPGENVALGADLRASVEALQCVVSDGGSESWQSRIAIWRPE